MTEPHIEAPIIPAAPAIARFPELKTYRLFRFPGSADPATLHPIDHERAYALREKRNARHREINDILAKKTISLGATPRDNQFVDLATKIGDSEYIFEVKTATQRDVLSRVREAVAQLLEYKYRTRNTIRNPILALLLEIPLPSHLAWLEDYLKQLGILLCWMPGDRIVSREQNRASFSSIIDDYVS